MAFTGASITAVMVDLCLVALMGPSSASTGTELAPVMEASTARVSRGDLRPSPAAAQAVAQTAASAATAMQQRCTAVNTAKACPKPSPSVRATLHSVL